MYICYIDGASKPADVFTPGDNPTYDTSIPLSSPVNVTNGQGSNGTTDHNIRSNTSRTLEREFDNPLYGSAAAEREPEYSVPGHENSILEPGVRSYERLDDSVTNRKDQPHYINVNGSVSAQQAVYEIPPQ